MHQFWRVHHLSGQVTAPIQRPKLHHHVSSSCIYINIIVTMIIMIIIIINIFIIISAIITVVFSLILWYFSMSTLALFRIGYWMRLV